MRYAVTLEYASGNNEYIWVAMKNDDLYMTATLPNRVIQNNNGNWFSGYSGVAPTLYSVEHFIHKMVFYQKKTRIFRMTRSG